MDYVLAYIVSIFVALVAIQFFKGYSRSFDKLVLDDTLAQIWLSAIWPLYLMTLLLVVVSDFLGDKIYYLGRRFRDKRNDK
jgi:hypothetical protein